MSIFFASGISLVPAQPPLFRFLFPPQRKPPVSDLDLFDAVAIKTGEDISEIQRHGFLLDDLADAVLSPFSQLFG